MTDNPKCETCRWMAFVTVEPYYQHPQASTHYECRRHPPKAFEAGDYGHHPFIHPKEGFCGEHEPKDAPAASDDLDRLDEMRRKWRQSPFAGITEAAYQEELKAVARRAAMETKR